MVLTLVEFFGGLIAVFFISYWLTLFIEKFFHTKFKL